MSFFNSPTLRLLNASTLTAVSGSIRLYLAFLLAGVRPDSLSCLAAGLTIYSTYTLDRALESKEDTINQALLQSARRDIGVHVSIITFLLGAGLFMVKNSYLAPFIPLAVGIIYSKGIHLGNRELRLKGSLGIKNLVIGLTWGGTIALVVARDAATLVPVLVIFLFFFGKLFINSVIYDMKDARGDLCAGIRTLPVVLGDRSTKLVLAGVCVFIHLLMALCMILGILSPETVILTVSFLSASCVILFYTTALETSASWLARNLRVLLIDCEAPAILILLLLTAG